MRIATARLLHTTFLQNSSKFARIDPQFVKLGVLLADKSVVAFFKALILSRLLKKN